MPTSVMTRRRSFLVAALAALSGPRALLAQPAGKVARVGILAPLSAAYFARSIDAFRQGLRERGWVEGRNLVIEGRYAGERYDRLDSLAAELVALKVDVFFALAGPAVHAAKRATPTIPIVMETLGDAISAGLVTNLARPGGNVTGVSGFAPELSGKRIEVLREMLPRATRVAVLANTVNPGTRSVLRATEETAQRLGVRVHVVDIRQPAELDASFETAVRRGSEALLVVADPLLFSQRMRIIELAARHRLPAVYETERFPEDGGLLSYGPDSTERFRRAAVYVDRVLRGEKAGDLPVEQPSQFELVINLKTARTLGITIPPTLRLRADRVIE
jgi:putative ABC transport system substrate-binding protein